MNRRKLLLMGGGTFSTVLAGCSGSTDDNENGDENGTKSENGGENSSLNGDKNVTENSEEESENGNETNEEAALSTPNSILEIEGYYDDDSAEFFTAENAVIPDIELDGGIVVVTFEHGSESDFKLDLYNSDDKLISSLALNPDIKVGDVGASAVPVESGTYWMDIDAETAVTLEVAQPNSPEEDVHQLPIGASGTGHDVIGPVQMDGEATISATHDGESYFLVTAIDEDGTGLADFEGISDVGQYNGGQSISMDAVTWIDIHADGDWTVEIE